MFYDLKTIASSVKKFKRRILSCYAPPLLVKNVLQEAIYFEAI